MLNVRRMLSRLPGISLCLVIILSMAVNLTTNTATAQSVSCSDLPSLKINKSIPVEANYRTWLLVKKDSASATPYVQINGGACNEFESPTSDDWQWISGKNGAVRTDLSAGVHEFKIAVNNGSILIDKILVTNDVACQPVDNGSNCIEETLDFSIDGISQNATLSSSRVVSATIIGSSIAGTSIEFLIDGVSIAKQQEAPFCLVLSGKSCVEYNFSSLTKGSHKLQVVGNTPGQQKVTKTYDFVVGDISSDGSSSVNDSIPLASGSPTKPDNLVLNVAGITANETVSGQKTISANVSGGNSPTSITFTLNDEQLAFRPNAPYCLTLAGSECVGWDTTTIANGNYTLYVQAKADGSANKTVSIPFSVNNPTITASIKNSNQQVIVGSNTQEISGNVKISISEKKLKEASTITYLVDDEVVGSATTINPETVIDTNKLTNGEHSLSAVIVSPSGEVETITSKIIVKNDGFTVVANSFEQNKLLSVPLGILSFVTIFMLVRYVAIAVRSKRAEMHRHMAQYASPLPKRHAFTPQLRTAQIFASVAIVVVGSLFVLRLGQTKAGVGAGFIEDVENGSPVGDASSFTMAFDETMSVRYARLNFTQTTVAQQDGQASSGNTSSPQTNNTPQAPTGTPTQDQPTSPTQPTPTPSQPAVVTPTHTGTHTGPYINTALIPGPVTGEGAARTNFLGDGKYYADGVGAFRTRCFYSHMNYDDPIVYPGQPGRAHLHTFFGNTGTNAYSTSSSLLNSGNSTCHGGSLNRTAYWIPSVIDGSGRPQIPVRLTAYYKTGYKGVNPASVQIMPDGLRMIAGDATRTTPEQGEAYNRVINYSCVSREDGSTVTYASSGFQVCPSNSYFNMGVAFPQCWNGRDLDSWNHKDHMAYATHPQGCPSSHPVALPEITENIYFEPNATMNTWRLSSDNYTGGVGGYSGHADWWNGWNRSVLEIVKSNCWNTGLDCRVENLGNGTFLTCNRSVLRPEGNEACIQYF